MFSVGGADAVLPWQKHLRRITDPTQTIQIYQNRGYLQALVMRAKSRCFIT